MTINNSVLSSYGYSNVSTMGDTVTVTSSPGYHGYASAGQTYTINTSTYEDTKKRYSLKNEGKLPYDVWAMMFNDNILND